MTIFVLSCDEENKCEQAVHIRVLVGLRVPVSAVRLHEDFPQNQNQNIQHQKPSVGKNIRRRGPAKS